MAKKLFIQFRQPRSDGGMVCAGGAGETFVPEEGRCPLCKNLIKDREIIMIRSTLKLMDKFARKRQSEREKAQASDYQIDPFLVEYELKNPYDGVQRHRRYSYKARVDLDCHGRVISGLVKNISSSGLFVEADPGVFAVRDQVILTISPFDDTRSTYRAIVRIVRVDSEGRGYGLKFATFD